MFPFYSHHTIFAHVVGRSSWIFFSLLLVGCGSGAAVVLHHLPSRLQEHLEPKPTSANDCFSKRALRRHSKFFWITVGISTIRMPAIPS